VESFTKNHSSHMVLELVLQSSDMENINTTTIPSSFAIPVIEKLHKSNYMLWHAQIMSSIRVTQLEGVLDGSRQKPSKTITKIVGESVIEEPNPTYAQWVAKDQAILSYLLMSLTHEVLTGVTTLMTFTEI
jgi:hypothetical protein